ncbi:MAG TPA: GntR family transcriptional regulator [Azospirillaceae bacterium]|nr:GntR family transcriptional regulator [Azospirillaceae bacterium]
MVMDGDAARADRLPSAMADFRPLYMQVRDLMVQRIASGDWKPGEMIPSEFQLAAEFGVSQGTVRKALIELEAQNLMVRRQGRGTTVAEHSRQHSLFHFFHIVDRDGMKELPSSTVVEQKTRKASKDQAVALALAPRANVHAFTRVRLLRGRPVILERIAVPAALFPDLSFTVGETLPDELYVLFQRKYGVTVARANETIAAVAADADDVRHLGLAEGAPLLEIVRVAHDVQGRPVELRVSRVDTRDHRYYCEIV